MTTKKARSRRLVLSDAEISTSTELNATCGHLHVIAVSMRLYRKHRHFGEWWGASLWDGNRRVRQLRTRTRLALHDAILRAGWPSPWREVER